jgi:hypothetical protein
VPLGDPPRIRRWSGSSWALPARWGAVIVGLAFLASRFWYHARGIRFDVSTIPYFDQLLDPILLRGRLWESLFYLHGQPPLFNLLTGVALKAAPTNPKVILLPVFLACGLYLGLCQYLIMVRLRVPVIVATLTASAIVASPACVLYENWYFYPHLNVAWLLGAVAWLAQSRGRPGGEMAISAAHLGGLSLTRSLFHPLFFGLAATLIVALVSRGARRKALACFALPGLLLFLWCAKNQVLFGFFGTSSWGSRNVSHAVETIVGANRVQAEARLGHLSPAIGVGPFESGTRNEAVFGLTHKTTGIPALDNVNKQVPSSHSVSYNHWSYPATAHFYAHDARQLIASYPRTYFRGLLKLSLPNFLLPVDQSGFFQPNRDFIATATARFDSFDHSDAAQLILAAGLALSLVAACARATARGDRMVLALAFLAFAWVTSVGLVGELGENNRFRYKVLWLAWAVAIAGHATAIRSLRGAFRSRRRVGVLGPPAATEPAR